MLYHIEGAWPKPPILETSGVTLMFAIVPMCLLMAALDLVGGPFDGPDNVPDNERTRST